MFQFLKSQVVILNSKPENHFFSTSCHDTSHEGIVSASGHCVIVGGSQSEQLLLIALFVLPQLFSCHNFSSWYFTVFLHVPQTSACQDIKCTLSVLFQKLLSSLDQFCADEETVLDCCESDVKHRHKQRSVQTGDYVSRDMKEFSMGCLCQDM